MTYEEIEELYYQTQQDNLETPADVKYEFARACFKAGQETEKVHWAKEIEKQVHDAHQGGMQKVVEFLRENQVKDAPEYLPWAGAVVLSKAKLETFLKENGLK